MATPDNRRHHWVPVSYLRPWQDIPGDKGRIKVERVANGKVIDRFQTRPERILYKKGYYDMSQTPEPITPPPSDLLETGIFAEAMEAAYVKTRSKTLDCGKIPEISQAAFLAECCITLYYRCPRFQRMADKFYDHPEFSERDRKFCQHHGARTLTLTIGGAHDITKHCLFHFLEAVGKERFWTSDTPCWMWHQDGGEWKRTTDIRDLEQRIQKRETSTRWVCAVTPKYVLEICPSSDAVQLVHHSKISDYAVRGYNQLILSVADELIIRP